MSLSTTLKGIAANIINEFGIVCSFTHETEVSFNAAEGSRVTTSSSFTAYGAKDSFDVEEINESTILATDIKLVMEAGAGKPQIDDKCVIGSEAYRVMSVTTVDPANVDIIYEVQLRR